MQQMQGRKILSPDQIEHAKKLRSLGYSKKELAILFHVGETTIWENIIDTRKRIRDRTLYFKQYAKRRLVKKVCIPCGKCGICMVDEFEILGANQLAIIPRNYRMENKCIVCYMNDNKHLLESAFGDAEWLPDWLKEL